MAPIPHSTTHSKTPEHQSLSSPVETSCFPCETRLTLCSHNYTLYPKLRVDCFPFFHNRDSPNEFRIRIASIPNVFSSIVCRQSMIQYARSTQNSNEEIVRNRFKISNFEQKLCKKLLPKGGLITRKTH